MASKNLTPWFPADVLPVRAGVYERRFPGSTSGGLYSFWCGRIWHCYGTSVRQAARYGLDPYQTAWLKDEWRGLAEDPNARR